MVKERNSNYINVCSNYVKYHSVLLKSIKTLLIVVKAIKRNLISSRISSGGE